MLQFAAIAFIILVPLGVALAFAGYAVTVLHLRQFPDGSARVKHFLGTGLGSREHKTPTARALIRIGIVCLAFATVAMFVVMETIRQETVHRSLPG